MVHGPSRWPIAPGVCPWPRYRMNHCIWFSEKGGISAHFSNYEIIKSLERPLPAKFPIHKVTRQSPPLPHAPHSLPVAVSTVNKAYKGFSPDHDKLVSYGTHHWRALGWDGSCGRRAAVTIPHILPGTSTE